MNNRKMVPFLFSFFLASVSFSFSAYAESDHQRLQAIRDKKLTLALQARELLDKKIGSRNKYSSSDAYYEKYEDAIHNDPELVELYKELDRLDAEGKKLEEVTIKQVENLVYDIGSGSKDKKNLTPEEWDLLRSQQHTFTKSQKQVLEEAEVKLEKPPTADDFLGELEGDLQGEMDKRGLGDREVPKDELEQDVFDTMDQLTGGLGSFMGGSGSSTPSGVDSRSMQSGAGHSMSASSPSGGEGHQHGPSGRDR